MRLDTPTVNGLHAVPANVTTLRATMAGAHDVWRVMAFAPAAMPDKAAWLAALADALQFPSSFGRNWDAAADSLQDLGWLPWQRLVLEVRGAETFLLTDEGRTALEVLAEAATYWKTHGRVFVALIDGLPGAMGA